MATASYPVTPSAAAPTPSSSGVASSPLPTPRPSLDLERTPDGVSAFVGQLPWAEDIFVNENASKVNDKEQEVKLKVLEKKKKFHQGRPLELKNLPEGCTQQVRQLRHNFQH